MICHVKLHLTHFPMLNGINYNSSIEPPISNTACSFNRLSGALKLCEKQLVATKRALLRDAASLKG